MKNRITRMTAALLAAVLSLGLLVGCKPKKELTRYSTIFYDVFDTVTQVIAYCDSEEEFSRQMDALHADLLEYHKLYDIYNDYDGITNIKTINGVPVLGAGDIKTPAPTKVSELENDKGFLTEHQSLEAYYQKAAAQLDNRVVAEAIVSLAARLDALEGSRGLLGDATAGTVDVRGLTRCRYPLVMLGHGVPAEANVPVNLPDGLPWDGVPVFIGQLYINLDATSGGLYYATGHDSVADWKQA